MDIQERQFSVSFLTEAGAVATSKEYFTGVELADFACWVIAEQLDSCMEKESARLAAEEVIAAFTAQPTISRLKIKAYLTRAHQKLLAESVNNQIKLRAGLLVVATDYRQIIYAVSGNVRLYHLRQGRINFRSKDQTMAQVMLDAGNLAEAEVSRRNERNSLINFLGITAEFKPLVAPAYQLQDHDQLLLCTISLWENFTNEEIATVWSQAPDPVVNLNQLKIELLTRKPQTQHFIMAAIVFKQVRRRRWRSISGQAWPKIAVGAPLFCLILIGAILLKNFSISRQAPTTPPRSSKIAVRQSRPTLRQPQPKEPTAAPEEVVQADLIRHTIAVTPPVQAPFGPERAGLWSEPPLVRATAVASINSLKTNVRQDPERKVGEVRKPGQYQKEIPAAEKPKVSIGPEKLKNGSPEAAKPKVSIGPEELEKTLSQEAKPKVTAQPEQSGKAVTEISKPKKVADPLRQTAELDGRLADGAVIPEKSSLASEREQRALRGKTLEGTGDDLFRQEKYNEALEYYKQAYRIYQESGMKEAAVLVDWKINQTIKEKLRSFLKQGFK